MKNLLTSLFLLSIAIQATAQSPDSTIINQVDSLIQISKALTGDRNFPEAHKINDEALDISLKSVGEKHASYADCLFNKGRIFHFMKNVKEAERNYKAAAQIQEEVLGEHSIVLSKSLNNLSILLKGAQRHKEVEPLYLKIIEIQRNTVGENDPKYADALNNLGQLYWMLGRFEESESYYLEVKKIRKKVLGEDHQDYAQILHNLATTYSDSKRLEAAERLYFEAMQLQEKTLGKESWDYAWSINNLGLLNLDLGKYEESEANLIEAKDIWEKIVGKETEEYAAALDNLASLYFKIGLFDAAEPLYYEALEIKENLKSDVAALAVSYNDLAVLHMAEEEYQKAEPLLLKAKEAIENTIGTEHNDYAWCVNNLGILYDKVGRDKEATAYIVEANAVRKNVLGEDHPDYANGLEDLAIFYQKIGKTKEALELHLTAKSIFEKAYGKSHPRYEECIRNLAAFYRKEGDLAAAYPLVLEANQLQRELLTRASKHLTEQELAERVASFGQHLDELYALAQTTASAEAGLAYDNALFHNGFLLNASKQMRRMASRNGDAALEFEKLTALNRRLGDQYALPQEERSGIGEMESQANELEKQLVKKVAGMGSAIQQVTWQQVQEKLQPGEAAVEFLRFHDMIRDESPKYAALVLKSDSNKPMFVQLCSEAALDSLFGGSLERRGEYVAGLYGSNERGATAVEQPKRTLYELLWQPMESSLEGVEKVYFATAGKLHRLNLGAIGIINSRKCIADKYKINQLRSTRQLVVPSPQVLSNNDAVVFGAIVYDIDTTYINSEEFEEDLLASRNRSRSGIALEHIDTTTRGGALRYLEYTKDEIEYVEEFVAADNMNASFSTGINATEEVFKEMSTSGPSPKLLHVATHGFFFPDPKIKKRLNDSEAAFKISDNPLMRSGLVLAGGNHAWTTGKSYRSEMEDGILTAFEISQMDLSNTELVVLSACETGLGDIVGSEGVYGLQRAVKIAGSKYLIMSLWQVPDKQTSKLMKRFYSNWLEDKMEIKEAFYAAQKDMREDFDPFYWAGFILVE